MTFVSALEPKPVWSHFDAILTIPRASKDEERMRRHVIDAAKRAGCGHAVDDAGNVVVRKPAAAGREAAPVTILQSHLDMVQEKNADVAFDFAADAIVPRREGDHLYATGTTLGADNGIGVAAMLAVLEAADLIHGPLELLFTIDEETGLNGARDLDAGLLTGRRLINLDSEEEGILCVGSAGGGDTQITLRTATAPTGYDDQHVLFSLTGLTGGHSGLDIHLQRGNALCLLTRALWAAHVATPFRLVRLEGGSAHNAIPREASATIVVDTPHRDRVVTAVEAEFAEIRNQYRSVDPGIALRVESKGHVHEAWTPKTTANALRLIASLPHGIEARSYDIPDLVETSNNLATIKASEGKVTIKTSSRSSVDAALDALRRRIRATAELANAEVIDGPAYPGWKPNLDSPLLDVVKAVHERELGSTPAVKAYHAGLECCIIGKKLPGMDMISFGPVIEFPHSPAERVQIDSVERFYHLLTATLAALSKIDQL